MLGNSQIYLLILVFSVSIYWLIPPQVQRWRQHFLLAMSALVVLQLSAIAFVASAAMITVTWFGVALLSRYKGSHVVLGCAIVSLLSVLVFASVSRSTAPIATIGLSYVLFKCYTVLYDQYWTPGERLPTLSEIGLVSLFFPTYTAGPLVRQVDVGPSAFKLVFDPGLAVDGVLRIALGLFKVSFLSAALVDGYVGANWAAPHDVSANVLSSWDAWSFALLKLLSLYLGFSGYSDVAIGAGRLFGVVLPENFNYPFLARNIQEFWQRWHMSMSRLVNVYLFIPFLRLTGRRRVLAIFLSFLVVGIWHQFNVNYAIWGACHGGLLALNMWWSRTSIAMQLGAVAVIGRLLGWLARIFVILVVALLSAFANAPDLASGWTFVRSAFGGK